VISKCAVAGPALDQVDRVDVATCIVGVWARLMRRVHQILGGLALQTRKADVETGREKPPKTARHLMPALKMILPLAGGAFVPGKPAQD